MKIYKLSSEFRKFVPFVLGRESDAKILIELDGSPVKDKWQPISVGRCHERKEHLDLPVSDAPLIACG